MSRPRDLLLIALLDLAAMGAVVWQMRDARAGAVQILPPPTLTPAPRSTAAALHVYVSGAVASPGVVELPEGARADDAVKAAGGLRPEADASAVNLAALVTDGAQLHVVAVGEAPRAMGPTAAMVARAPSAGLDGGAMLNVNQATAAELEALPGIGPALAERIVAYRLANGPFASIDDLAAVSGIGERTLEKFRDRVTVR